MFILAVFHRESSTEQAHINGITEAFFKEILLRGKGKVKVYGNRVMETSLKESIMMIWSMAGANLLGKMDKFMKESLGTIFDMVKATTSI